MGFKIILFSIVILLITTLVIFYYFKKEKFNPYNTDKKIITVFASSRDEINNEYKIASKKLIELIDDKKFNIVYGGNNGGLMDIVSQVKGKENILSINYKKFHPEKDDIVYNDIFEREKHLIDVGNIYLFLPGGTGTITELMLSILFNQVSADTENDKKDILILNHNGVFNSFFTYLDDLATKKFVDDNYLEKYKIKLFNTPEELAQYLNNQYQ